MLDGAIASELDGSGLILVAIGTILAAVGAFAEKDPREGLPRGSRPSSARCTCRCSGSWSASASPRRPSRDAPLAFLGGEQGWILVLVLGVWAYDTGAYLSASASDGAFLTHISPSKT